MKLSIPLQHWRRGVCHAAIALASVLVAAGAHAQFLMSGTLITSTGTATTRELTAESVPVSGSGGTLMIPAQAFTKSDFAFRTFSFSPSVAQLASSFTSSNAAVTVVPGGGPGSFSWCPQGNIPCTDPDAGADPGWHGLLIYSDGGGFGGTFEVMRNIANASLARILSQGTYSHSSPQPHSNPWPAGLPFSSTVVSGSLNGPVLITTGAVLGPEGSIQTIGTTGMGMLNVIGTEPPTPTRFFTGFPATTGMIFAFDRTGAGASMYTWTGSDQRDANGHGNITLVAGGFQNNLQGEVFPQRLIVTMTLPEASTSVGMLAGLVALVYLVRARRR